MKWYGIKDECCTDSNINLIGFNSVYGQCTICKRIFKHA